jgi:hypothetical protein
VVSLKYEEDFPKLCSSLLISFIAEDDSYIKLAHFSVKEYLLIREFEDIQLEVDSSFRFSTDMAHTTITLRYLDCILNESDPGRSVAFYYYG